MARRYLTSSSPVTESEARAAYGLPASTPKGDGTTPTTTLHPVLRAKLDSLDAAYDVIDAVLIEVRLVLRKAGETKLDGDIDEARASLARRIDAVRLAASGGVK